MSFDGARHARTADQPLPSNQRRVFLEVLHHVINYKKADLKAIFATRTGCPVLFVLNRSNATHTADVGCDFDQHEGWAFNWAADGRTIGPADDPDGVADAIERTLRARPEGHAWACFPSASRSRRSG